MDSLPYRPIFTVVVSLLFLLPFSYPKPDEQSLRISPSAAFFPKLQAEKLISQLNLFPENSINVVSSSEFEDTESDKKIVEKRFELPIHGAANTGPSVQELGHYAGYYKIKNSKAARMFYLFFESRNNKKDPVVIWLTGGPGCSSELAVFYENGPFQIGNNLSLSWNKFGWDMASNLLYVDQPIGTGFSYTTNKKDIRHGEEGVSGDLYDFLQSFFAEHPQYVENDFYITGESYAGHYIPAFASRVHRGNKNKEGIHINLKGFAIGNGLTNPEIQYEAYTDYALDMNLISKTDHEQISRLVPRCKQAIKTCVTGVEDGCETSFGICNNIFNNILGVVGDTNYYDVRKQCEGALCYDFSNMETFLNEKSVRTALGVGNINFVSCSSEVYEAMTKDWMRNLELGIPSMIEDGIKVLIYAGEYDLICNWLGNSRWVHAMEWSGQKTFSASPTIPFTVNGKEAGLMKGHGPLSFLRVHDAGHMVPMDQPEAALEMLKTWMQGKLVVADSEETISPE